MDYRIWGSISHVAVWMNTIGTYMRYIISTLTVLSYCMYTSFVFFS